MADPVPVGERFIYTCREGGSVGPRTSMDALDIRKSLPPAWNRTTILCYPTGSSVSVPVLLSSTFIINPLNAELNPIRHLLALVGARHIVHVSRIRFNRGFIHCGKRNFSLMQNFRTASWAHQTSYSVDTNGLLPKS